MTEGPEFVDMATATQHNQKLELKSGCHQYRIRHEGNGIHRLEHEPESGVQPYKKCSCMSPHHLVMAIKIHPSLMVNPGEPKLDEPPTYEPCSHGFSYCTHCGSTQQTSGW